jgi:hypothetical protein
MSLPTSISAYRAEQEAFDTASQGEKGARFCLGTYEACVGFRQRLHYFRSLDRKQATEIYPTGDPRHGISSYDEFEVTILPDEDGEHWVYIQRRSAKFKAVELLDNDHDLIPVEPVEGEAHEVHQIEDHSNG